MSVQKLDSQISNETASAADSTRQCQLEDLVQISVDDVGVVVRIENESLHLLDSSGKVQVIPVQSATKAEMNRNSIALDSQNNHLNVEDIVDVVDGPFANRQGRIRHLYRD